METKFKLGQKVWSIQLGDCEVVKINKGDEYPILCKNKDEQEEEYNYEGYYYTGDKHPSLFSSNPFFEERVMEVSDDDVRWHKRVVFKEKLGSYLSWAFSECVEESENQTATVSWCFAREVNETPQIVELTLKDISEMYKKANGVDIPVELLRIKK